MPTPRGEKQQAGGKETNEEGGNADNALLTALGEAVQAGRCYYAAMEAFQPNELDEDEEPCQECGKIPSDSFESIVECEMCLRGYHLSCLDPPLYSVPSGEWQCNACRDDPQRRVSILQKDGERRDKATARERLLCGKYRLVMVEYPWMDKQSTRGRFLGRWFVLPEETHVGRDFHHHSREVFLTKSVDVNDVECLVREAHVLPFNAFRQAENEGDDVLMCNYEYDEVLNRFRLIDNPHEVVSPEWEDQEEDDDFHRESAQLEKDDDDEELRDTVKEKFMHASKRQKLATEFFPVKKSSNKPAKMKGGTRQYEAVKELLPKQKESDVEKSHLTPLECAIHHLSSTFDPDMLPCRESERNTIFNFAKTSLQRGGTAGRCLYVSGVPGTGKTATVTKVIQELRSEAVNGKVAKFDFAYVNGLKIQSPKHAYSVLWEELTGRKASPEAALEELENHFSKSQQGRKDKKKLTAKQRPAILVVDELDQLLTSDQFLFIADESLRDHLQKVLYNLFEWPTRSGMRLAVIGIANTLDLPQRLMPRITSRLAFERAQFMPYQRDELNEILDMRLQGKSSFMEAGNDPFKANAKNLAASKVAAVSGDARRCLHMARRAAEIASHDRVKEVTVDCVHRAIQESFQSSHLRQLQGSSMGEKFFLAALCLDLRASGLPESDILSVYRRLKEIQTLNNEEALPLPAIGHCVMQLAQRGIILADFSIRLDRRRVALNVPRLDVEHFLGEHDKSVPWLSERLRNITNAQLEAC